MNSTSPIDHLLQFFTYSHLPPSNPETAAGLRKLLEAKDCFVRARLVARSASNKDAGADLTNDK